MPRPGTPAIYICTCRCTWPGAPVHGAVGCAFVALPLPVSVAGGWVFAALRTSKLRRTVDSPHDSTTSEAAVSRQCLKMRSWQMRNCRQKRKFPLCDFDVVSPVIGSGHQLPMLAGTAAPRALAPAPQGSQWLEMVFHPRQGQVHLQVQFLGPQGWLKKAGRAAPSLGRGRPVKAQPQQQRREVVNHPDPGHSMHVPVVGQHPSKVMSLFPQPPHPRYQCWRGVSLGCRKVLKIHLCLNIEVGGVGGRPPSRKRDITFEGGGSTFYRNFWPDFGASGAQRIVYRIWPTLGPLGA